MIVVDPISSIKTSSGGTERFSGVLLRLQSTVAHILSEARSEAEACARLLESICVALELRWGAVWIRRGNRLELLERFCADDDELQEFDELSRACHFLEAEGLPGRIWAEGGPVWIEDCAKDARMPRRRAAVRCHLQSALGFPISGREFIGVIEFFDGHIPQPSTNVAQVLLSIGAQLGQFIEKRRAERALADSQSLFQAVFNSEHDAIVLADDDGALIEANPAALKLLGFSRAEVLAKRIWEILPGAEEHGRKQWRRFLEAREEDGEFSFARADGSHVEVEYRASARIAPGVHLWLLRDVSERKHKEEKTRLLAQAGVILGEGLDFAATLKHVARLAVPAFADWCLVDLLEGDGSIRRIETTHFDPAMEAKAREMHERFPIDPDRKVGSPNVLKTGRSEFLRIDDDLLRRVLTNREHFEAVQQFHLIASIIVPLKAQGKTFGAISFLRCRPRQTFAPTDIEFAEELGRRAGWAIDNARHYEAAQQELRRREKAERELRDLNRELEQRIEDRTAALKESHSQMEAFCYSVSHDLRAPLRSMQGFSHALLEDHSEQLNEEGKDFARRILSAAEHMDGLLADVLTYSRLSRQQLEPEPIEVSKVTLDAQMQLQGEIKKKNAVTEADCPGRVVAHRSALELMILNLIDNALKFVPKDVTPQIKIATEARGAMRRIWVRDNGIGIPIEHQQKIFRIFERLHGMESYPGTGIGLALVQKAAERMNGAVGVESTPGKGSAFWIDLPDPDKVS